MLLLANSRLGENCNPRRRELLLIEDEDAVVEVSAEDKELRSWILLLLGDEGVMEVCSVSRRRRDEDNDGDSRGGAVSSENEGRGGLTVVDVDVVGGAGKGSVSVVGLTALNEGVAEGMIGETEGSNCAKSTFRPGDVGEPSATSRDVANLLAMGRGMAGIWGGSDDWCASRRSCFELFDPNPKNLDLPFFKALPAEWYPASVSYPTASEEGLLPFVFFVFDLNGILEVDIAAPSVSYPPPVESCSECFLLFDKAPRLFNRFRSSFSCSFCSRFSSFKRAFDSFFVKSPKGGRFRAESEIYPPSLSAPSPPALFFLSLFELSGVTGRGGIGIS